MTDTDPLAAALALASPDAIARAEQRIREIAEATAAFMRDAWVALEFNGITGDYAEFGCYGGQTMRHAYERISTHTTSRHMWAFDSFAGLPAQTDAKDEHPAWVSATMAMDEASFVDTLRSNGVPDDAYTTVVGFFDESLPAIGDGEPTDIALAYVDCDLYTSTLPVLDFLAPRLKHGMIIAFDDYYCWSSTALGGERAALLEFEKAHPEWNFHRYRDIGWGGASFVVEDRSLMP